MDIKEFNDAVKPQQEGGEIIFDLRPFGPRQGEAVDCYLHARLMHMNTTGIGTTDKLCVLLCDSTAQIPDTANHWLANLRAGGQRAEIRTAWSPVGRP